MFTHYVGLALLYGLGSSRYLSPELARFHVIFFDYVKLLQEPKHQIS